MEENKKGYILVVEDKDIVINLLKEFLPTEFSDYQIEIISLLHWAVKFGIEHLNDIKVCLVDGQIIDGYGWDFMTKMKEAGYSRKAIFIGAKMPVDEVQHLFNAFYLKPFNLDELAEEMRKSLND